MGQGRSRVVAISAGAFDVFFFFPRVLITVVPSRMGKPLPDSIYKERCQTRHGLKLLRGPDPRSFHPRMNQVSAMARPSMGLDL